MATRLDCRRAAGSLLGPFEVVVNTAASLDGSVVTIGWPGLSASNQSTAFDGYFLRRPATNETRLVKTPGGYDPSTGRIYPDTPFATALDADEEIEVQGIFDPRVIDALIDQALKLCYLVDEVVVPALNLVGRYNLKAVAPWLQGSSWVRQVSWLGTGETRDSYLDLYDRRPLRGEVRKIGSAIYWQGTYYSSSQSLYFLCVRRHYDFCRTSAAGVFGERSGLAADAHETDADADWVAAGVLLLAWQQFRRVLEQSTAQKQQQNQDDAAKLFTERTEEQFELPPRTIRAIPRIWGPPAGRRR